MFKLIKLPTRSLPARTPARLPISVLQVIPDFVDLAAADERPFNLIGAVAELLGPRGWDLVMAPRLWAPRRTSQQLRRAFPAPDGLRPDPFAPSRLVRRSPFALRSNTAVPHHNVIHLSCIEIDDKPPTGGGTGAGPFAVLAGQPALRIPLGQIRDMTIAHHTRLLLLERPRGEAAEEFARTVAGSGGPAVMIVQGADAGERTGFLQTLYATIVHGRALSDLAAYEPSADVTLVVGRGADKAFTLDALAKMIRDQVRALVRRQVRVAAPSAVALRHPPVALGLKGGETTSWLAEKVLHARQAGPLRSATRTVDRARAMVENLPPGPWYHESQGTIPLAEAIEELAQAESEILDTQAKAEREAVRAPRVLNANFASGERMIAVGEPLVADEHYDLCVDVGPRWKSGETIVVGNAEFPTEALPQSAEGHLIDVVFSTSDFDPPLSRHELWLPAFGASSAAADGAPRVGSGPVRLPLRVNRPATAQPRRRLRAHGRLCLYHDNNLLQSAVVSIGVKPSATDRVRTRNRIEVDFRLTGTYQDVHERFATRRLADGDEREVGLNITLNDDGGGSHRILVKTGADAAPAWMPYDPVAMTDLLDRGREELLNVFMERKENGIPRMTPGLDRSNGKRKRQFELDIYVLARIGEQLFNALTTQINPHSGSGIDWVRQLQQALADPSVIQIARTGSTPPQYVWPWDLLYTYPLPSYGEADEVRFCDVLDEWGQDGVRNGSRIGRCPYESEDWHQEDILCPFGFWGLKHMVEQPLSPLVPDRRTPGAFALLDATSTGSLRGAEPRFGVGVTGDEGLDRTQIDAHVRALASLFALSPAAAPGGLAPATTRKALRRVLARAGVGYFLCHGMTDEHQHEPFLGLGPNPGRPENRIYPTTIISWARATRPDIAGNWRGNRPLVFINGCHTTDLAPGAILNFVDSFATLGAGGVIGTEVSVRLPVAFEMAQLIFAEISKGIPIAKALHEARWTLANKGNLLGLAYTLFGLADFRMEA